jgi:hypothetical protein
MKPRHMDFDIEKLGKYNGETGLFKEAVKRYAAAQPFYQDKGERLGIVCAWLLNNIHSMGFGLTVEEKERFIAVLKNDASFVIKDLIKE